MSDEVRCAAEGLDILGEGPMWHAAEGRLYWFDIKGRRLNWLNHADGARGGWNLPWRASVAAPRTAGGLVLATEAGIAHLDTATGAAALVSPMDLGPGFRSNDGKIDLAGRLWWSSMDDDGGKRPGALFRTDPDGTTHQVLDGIHIANTVSVSPDGRTMYFADSALQLIWAFAITDDGRLADRRVFLDMSGQTGGPDGSAVDAEGHLWNVQWGAWRMVRYAPDGSVDRIVALPVEHPTSCAFGGPDLSTLYVTSAREGLSAAQLEGQPLAGSVFALEPGVKGLPLPAFAG
ncbi:SMP-30/gluconolactonase/LRE family protein [Phenylobacterium aquaticum]|uniref:SMP-30/gluconolactonase/LRE family protein n=1 Tax=Phenylobacterium aquaticum TaxID=1763816 RepID=UPI0026EA6713|nr:SMP-30/gluconolactonase/LRE family protein [Phenylobacterium aquaticum]